MVKKICASCKNGESEDFEPAEAEVYVEGKIRWDDPYYGERWQPYRAYLCRGHMEMMEDDGAEFRIVRELK